MINGMTVSPNGLRGDVPKIFKTHQTCSHNINQSNFNFFLISGGFVDTVSSAIWK